MDRCNRKFPFLCQVDADYIPTCSEGWMSSGGYCWKSIKQKLNYNDASQYCHRIEDGSKLGETTTPTEAKAVYDVITNDGIDTEESIWLGLCHNESDWIWQLSQTNTDSFASWSYGEPTLKGHTQNCATAIVDPSSQNVLWTSEQIENEHYFICQVNHQKLTGSKGHIQG